MSDAATFDLQSHSRHSDGELAPAAVVEAATVTDTDGNVIDTAEFFGRLEADDVEPAGEAEEADEAALAEAIAAPSEQADDDTA